MLYLRNFTNFHTVSYIIWTPLWTKCASAAAILSNISADVRLIQNIYRFDILGITETHLNSTDPDRDIHIDGLEFLRLDRKERKGGGCVLYYADYLKFTHRKDLVKKDSEAMWIQAKFPTTNLLFSVIYRSELFSPNFFTNLQDVLECIIQSYQPESKEENRSIKA